MISILPPAGGKLCEAFNILIVCQKNTAVNPFCGKNGGENVAGMILQRAGKNTALCNLT